MTTRHRFVVAEGDALARLDQFLAGQGLPLSRSQLKRHIDEGHVTIDGVAANFSGYDETSDYICSWRNVGLFPRDGPVHRAVNR